MRRSTTISQVLLLLAFYFVPLAAPSATPACCRRDGAHHCAMLDPGSGGQITFSGAVQCPYRFPAIVLTHATRLSLSPASVNTPPPVLQECPLHENAGHVLTQLAAALDNRGPPSLTL